MIARVLGCALLALAGAEPVATDFVQLQPPPSPTRLNMWTREHSRAVILIHGLLVRPLSEAPAKKAVLHSWQRSDSALVKTLSRDSDIFALAYSQNASVDDVAIARELPAYVARLQMMGYGEIVLLGHSAGGIIARQFVEDRPQCGVTKVIQICTPNDGSSLARANLTIARGQGAFMESLTREARQKQTRARAGKRIPPNVEFVCIVARNGLGSDGVVGCPSQWPEDLQRQGIPYVTISATHHLVLRTTRHAEQIARAVREPHPRWTEDKVETMRQRLLGKSAINSAAANSQRAAEKDR